MEKKSITASPSCSRQLPREKILFSESLFEWQLEAERHLQVEAAIAG
jgi:hypothetical protein